MESLMFLEEMRYSDVKALENQQEIQKKKKKKKKKSDPSIGCYTCVKTRSNFETYFTCCICAVYFNNFLSIEAVIEQKFSAVRITIGL